MDPRAPDTVTVQDSIPCRNTDAHGTSKATVQFLQSLKENERKLSSISCSVTRKFCETIPSKHSGKSSGLRETLSVISLDLAGYKICDSTRLKRKGFLVCISGGFIMEGIKFHDLDFSLSCNFPSD